MNKNKLIGIAIWALGFALSMVFMFCLEQGLTPTFWVTFGFVIVAFLSTLIFQLSVWKSDNSLNEQFIHIPPMVLSSIYVLVQILLGIVFSLGSSFISVKIAILFNAIIFIVAWGVNILSLAGNDHIRKVNSRQKDHHIEL